MHNLANIYSYVGRVKEAIELQESILPLRIFVNGPKDPDTLRAMHNLAQSLHAAKRSPEAFKLHEKVLALRKELLGPNHPNTSAYFGTGRYDKALELRVIGWR
jgi:tetratricopeptide (TPR) repeat protein